MRPKSMATVVDVLPVLVPPVSSMPSATVVIAASVVSGAISEIEPDERRLADGEAAGDDDLDGQRSVVFVRLSSRLTPERQRA